MIRKKCPYCGKKISLWNIAKPGLSKNAGAVKCQSCSKIISKPWKDFIWILPLGFFMGIMIDRVITTLCSCPFYMVIAIDLFFVFLAGIILLLFFPLSKEDKS